VIQIVRPRQIHGCDATPTPSGFAETVSDDFPILHRDACALLIVQNGLRYSFARFRKIIQDSQDHDARPGDMIFPELAP
jgi:hypothetical protein